MTNVDCLNDIHELLNDQRYQPLYPIIEDVRKLIETVPTGDDINRIISEFCIHLDTIMDNLDDKERSINQLKSKLRKMQQEIVELKQEIVKLRQENAELRRENAELKQEVAELKQEVAKLKQDNVELRRENIMAKMYAGICSWIEYARMKIMVEIGLDVFPENSCIKWGELVRSADKHKIPGLVKQIFDLDHDVWNIISKNFYSQRNCQIHVVDYDQFCKIWLNKYGIYCQDPIVGSNGKFHQLAQIFEEFEYLGWFSENFTHDYVFINGPSNDGQYRDQYWSHGGITDEIKRSLEKTI